jgi:hypothetical protein
MLSHEDEVQNGQIQSTSIFDYYSTTLREPIMTISHRNDNFENQDINQPLKVELCPSNRLLTNIMKKNTPEIPTMDNSEIDLDAFDETQDWYAQQSNRKFKPRMSSSPPSEVCI